MKNEKVTLLVLAAGLGSRYKGQKQIDSLTKENESLMEFALYDALKLGLKKVVFITNDQLPEDYKNKLNTILSQNDCEAYFVEQTRDKFIPQEYKSKLEEREKPLGTAHAVYCAKDIIDEPFITINADDFYGYKTFESAFDSVRNNEISKSNYTMVAFELKNTLSQNGTVSRGVCEVENDKLKGVEEYKSIEEQDGVVKGINDETKEEKTLDHNDPVSMNFWVLDPSFFDLVERDLPEFMEQHEDLSKVEFYLPSVVDKAIQQNKVDVKVNHTDEKWFGLTYRNDKELAIREIRSKKEKGIYPEKLWA